MKVADLRDEIRFPMTPALKERFSLKLKRDDSSFIPLELVDVSMHGMRFRTDFDFKEDAVKEFTFTFMDKDDNEQELAIRSRICWIEREEMMTNSEIGAQIVEVTDKTWIKLIMDVIANM
jgi:hypothetical protein